MKFSKGNGNYSCARFLDWFVLRTWSVIALFIFFALLSIVSITGSFAQGRDDLQEESTCAACAINATCSDDFLSLVTPFQFEIVGQECACKRKICGWPSRNNDFRITTGFLSFFSAAHGLYYIYRAPPQHRYKHVIALVFSLFIISVFWWALVVLDADQAATGYTFCKRLKDNGNIFGLPTSVECYRAAYGAAVFLDLILFFIPALLVGIHYRTLLPQKYKKDDDVEIDSPEPELFTISPMNDKEGEIAAESQYESEGEEVVPSPMKSPMKVNVPAYSERLFAPTQSETVLYDGRSESTLLYKVHGLRSKEMYWDTFENVTSKQGELKGQKARLVRNMTGMASPSTSLSQPQTMYSSNTQPVTPPSKTLGKRGPSNSLSNVAESNREIRARTIDVDSTLDE